MPDYKEMYLTLFRAMTKANDILQEAQQKTEQMYIDDTENKLILLQPSKVKEDEELPPNTKS